MFTLLNPDILSIREDIFGSEFLLNIQGKI